VALIGLFFHVACGCERYWKAAKLQSGFPGKQVLWRFEKVAERKTGSDFFKSPCEQINEKHCISKSPAP
jgi:hypothetical protein